MPKYWIQLYTGKRFFLDDETTDISIVDIAWQLSQMPRFNGAANRSGPVSVAEHSCAVMEITADIGGTPAQQLAALMHDAHEIIFGDVPKPVKEFLKSQYHIDLNKIAAPYQAQIEICLGIERLAKDQYDLIDKADKIALAVERRLFMPSGHLWDVDAVNPPQYYDSFYASLSADEANQAFLKAYNDLKAKLRQAEYV